MHVLDEINRIGVDAIESLQISFPDSDDFFDILTKSFDPLYAFIVLFPLFVGINISLATDILVVSAVTEWLNTILKWLFREDRPYWWVRETGLYNATHTFRPILKQTPLTCETGPGSPSGHVMGAAALGYVFMLALGRVLTSSQRFSDGTKNVLRIVMWVCFAMLMFLVAVSRLYVSTHFPHQCMLGLLLGLAVAWAITSPAAAQWRTARRPRLLSVALSMSLFAIACYWLQKALGLDPQWSVKLAFKWCESPEWIHVNTTPLFCLVRDCGIFFGLALASPLANRYRQLQDSPVAELATCIGLAMSFHLASTSIPTANVYLYYACHFMLQCVQVYLYLVLVPIIGSIVKRKSD